MARGEGDSPLKSNFVERVVKLPVVLRALDCAAYTYSHIKESSRLANFTLTNAERTATFVAVQAKPVVLKFEKQIQVVDELACRGLGTLEQKAPFIKKPADQIIGDTRRTVHSRLEDIRKYGNDKVRSGLQRASAILGVLTSVDGALAVAQSCIDLLLPPSEDENQSNGTKEGNPSALARVARLSSAVWSRAHKTILVQIENFQEKAFDLFLIYPIRLIEISKTNVDAAVAYTHKLWAAIWQQEVLEANETEKNRIEQQLLHLARLVSKQVAATYTSFSRASVQSEGTSQELRRVPAVVVAVRDGVLSVLGILKVLPQLLPMYCYGLVSWLDEFRTSKNESKDGREEAKKNGSVPADGASEENNTHR